MAWEFSVLVVANVTASSDELLAALGERAEQGGCRFTLVMPASGADARERLDAALERMRAAGLDNVSGEVGDPDPIVAVMEAWDPMKFDEILVSTLPTGSSRWPTRACRKSGRAALRIHWACPVRPSRTCCPSLG